MTFAFAQAKREQVSLLIALAGASGSGKTFSALRLAKGMSPDGKIAFIDTEARRGLHYAETFHFLHSDMRPAFSPARFMAGIRAAEETGAGVIIIDSFSHEYDGEGGLIDWADREASAGVKGPAAWKEPKAAHKKLMGMLLQCRASIIFCLRADEKIEILREAGKTVVRPLGWMPICEKRFMYEMTCSFTLTPDRPGIPHFDLPHKLQSQHRAFFTDKEPISEQSGHALAAWARGGEAAPLTSSQGAADTTDDWPPKINPLHDDIMMWDSKLHSAAQLGTVALLEVWKQVPKPIKTVLKEVLDRDYKPTAAAVPA